MDKETLAAFADGELSPEDAARVVMHLADHPADQAWVDDLMASNALLARAYAAPLAEPVPDRFRDLILPETAVKDTGAKVIPFRARLRRALPAMGGLGLAAAAALAAVVVMTQPGTDDARLAAGPVPADSVLGRALDGQQSGTATPFGSGELTILATLPAANGYCREFEVMDGSASRLDLGLACRSGEGWTVDVALTEALVNDPGDDGFTSASGDEAATLDRWLTARQAGMALTPEEEAALITGGWR